MMAGIIVGVVLGALIGGMLVAQRQPKEGPRRTTRGWLLGAAGGALIGGLLGGISAHLTSCSVPGQEAYDAMPQVRTAGEFAVAVEQAKRPVLVDFGATWCPSCRALAPRLGTISRDYHGKVDFARIDVDQAGGLARAHGAHTIPLVLVFVNGKEVNRFVGLLEEQIYRDALDAAIKTAATQPATTQSTTRAEAPE